MCVQMEDTVHYLKWLVETKFTSKLNKRNESNNNAPSSPNYTLPHSIPSLNQTEKIQVQLKRNRGSRKSPQKLEIHLHIWDSI